MCKNPRLMMVFMLIVSLSFSLPALADNDYQVGTRGEGIGFAFSALADEPFGALYNPAGLSFTQGLQTQIGCQVPTEYGLSPINESPYGAAFGLNYYNPEFGNITLNTHQFGSFSDPSFVTAITSTNLSYGRSFSGQIGVGVGFKYMIETNFAERKAFDMDLGISYHPMPALSIAAVGENLLRAKMTPDDVFTTHLSRKFRLAAAYHAPMAEHNATFLAGWQLEQAGEPDINNTSLFNVGTEWWLGAYNTISLGIRGGYTFGKTTILSSEEDYNRWSAGISLNFDIHGNDLRIDYAIRSFPFDNDETLPSDNFLSVSYGWGGVPEYFDDKSDDTYDLAKYQKEQSWQAPAMIEDKPEPVPPSEPWVAELEAEPQPQVIVVETIQTEPTADEQQTAPSPEITQAPDEPNQTTTPEIPKPATAPQPTAFAKLNIDLDATQLGGIGGNKVVFSLKPEGILYLKSWKLYVFATKVNNWNDITADDYALAVIRGKGITPLRVIWDGTLSKGGKVEKGKYYFVVIGEDSYSTRYMSEWCKFKVK